MSTFIKAVFLMLAASAKADKIWEPSDSTGLNIGTEFLSEERQNRRPGSSYCTYSPDYDCYRDGWPSCCQDNGGRDCPSQQPQCDSRRPGSSYCTYSPDYDCYRDGWPSCCQDNGGRDCPREQPQCNTRRPPNPRPTRRPTRRPSRRPTRRPTPNPTRRPTNRRPTDDATGDRCNSGTDCGNGKGSEWMCRNGRCEPRMDEFEMFEQVTE